MPFRFTLTNTATGASTIIDEPVGMDKVSLHLKRDENYHGFLDAIDDSLGSFQFYGAAYKLLKTAYNADGVDADVRLLIEYQCSDTDSYEQLYEGKFAFDQYKEIRGASGCYIECPIQNGYDLQTFRSRMNQKVSLDSLSTFDNTVSLNAYSHLGQDIKLNPKTVKLTNYATVDTTGNGSNSFSAGQKNINGDYYTINDIIQTLGPDFPSFANPEDNTGDTSHNEFTILTDNPHEIIPYTTIRSSEFGSFPGGVGDQYFESGNTLPGSVNEIFQYTPEIPYDNNEIQIDIDIAGAIIMGIQGDRLPAPNESVEAILLKGLTWEDAKSHHTTNYVAGVRDCRLSSGHLVLYDFYSNPYHPVATLVNYITEANAPFAAGNTPTVDYRTFRFTYHERVQFYPGEKLFLFFIIGKEYNPHLHTVFFSNNYTYRNTFYITSGAPPRSDSWLTPVLVEQLMLAPTVTVGGVDIPPPSESYIRLTFDSGYKATTTPCYLVNEALSRAVEITTNDSLRVYSEYFGRAGDHASQPYAAPVTGAGALTGLTNGLLLRGSSPLQTWHMGYSDFHSTTVNAAQMPYTLSHTDGIIVAGAGNILMVNDNSDCTVYIPDDVAEPTFGIGTQLIIQQNGSGVVTVSPVTGVTLAAPGGGVTTSGYGSQVLLTKVGPDSWLLSAHAPMFASFQEMIEALNAIHAIGFGLEHDGIRTDHTDRFYVRIEPIRYFYNDALTLMTCDNVESIETDAGAGDAISIFKTGYTKWEAEQANGLDEFLSRREYRTRLRTLRKTLDKQCKYVASGYAIEVTRRKLNTNTTDWRYDNDTFIICLQNNVPIDGDTSPQPDYMSESGGVSGATGLLNDATVYNYRISPARNALRWLPYILNSYADWQNGELVFAAGDGNYTAQGQLINDPVEGISLNESANLKWDALADHTLYPAIYRNEVVKFKYPMSYHQWQHINEGNNKYGKIRYNVNDSPYEEGYILDLKYDLFGGMAEFTLRPAI